jgi:hypothetical protein
MFGILFFRFIKMDVFIVFLENIYNIFFCHVGIIFPVFIIFLPLILYSTELVKLNIRIQYSFHFCKICYFRHIDITFTVFVIYL